jgi:chaperone modulatory protein CbpM
MTIERTELVWAEIETAGSIDDLMRMTGLSRAAIDDLIECGALPPTPTADVRVTIESVVLARAAGRLREHFELDDRGLAVAIALLRRVRALEARLAELRARGGVLAE